MTNQKLQGIQEPREQIPQKKENKGRFLLKEIATRPKLGPARWKL